MRKITVWAFCCLLFGCAPKARNAAQGHAEKGDMKMRLQRVYLQDNLLWLRFRVWNRSAYAFRVGWMEFTVRQRHRMRRTAFQELRLQPRVRREPPVIPGDSKVELVYGLAPRVIGSDKEMVAELREGNDDRILRVVIGGRILARARRE